MPNLALISIPAYYILCMAPHAYAASLSPENVSLQKKLSNRVSVSTSHSGKAERAESAHKTNFDHFPLFAATICAGLLSEKVAKKNIGTVNFAAAFLGLRAVNTLLFINAASQAANRVRSLTFVASVGVAFYHIYKAAVALA